jgi:hypothetical protein
MVLRKIEDAFGLKMDVCAEDVIDEAILYCGTVAHNHPVGFTGRCAIFSNPFKREGQFDYSSLFDDRFPSTARYRKLSPPITRACMMPDALPSSKTPALARNQISAGPPPMVPTLTWGLVRMKTSFAAIAELGAQTEKKAASARIAMTLVCGVIVLMDWTEFSA